MAHVHPGMYVYINYIYSSSWYILVCAHMFIDPMKTFYTGFNKLH